MAPSIEKGWKIVDVSHDNFKGEKYTNLLWSRNDGKVKTTTIPGEWDYDTIVAAYSPDA